MSSALLDSPPLSVAGPPPAREEILARVPDVAAAIAEGAAARDLSGELPFFAFKLIREARLGALRVPARLGGPGGSLRDVIETVAALAAGDSNVAHALRPHFNFCETLFLGPDSPEQTLRARQILDGALFGGASTELGTPRPGGVTATLRKTARGLRLDGRKYYATGTSYSDFFYTNALDDSGNSVRILLPVGRPGVEILEDWDGMGQRTSGSGGLRFTDVEVFPEEVNESAPSPAAGPVGRHASTLRQLVLMACQVGSARSLLAEAVGYVKSQARPIAHSPAETARADPFVQREVGRLAAFSHALDALLRDAADEFDRSAAEILSGHPDVERLVTQHTFAVVRAQIVIGPLALQAAETIFNVSGGSATSRSRNFDRHWRNIRTIMSHNPLYHKERALGDHILNDAPTPPGGAF
jgi:alkylation response protein AidB-like acyl-CoA dehydrogenase